MKYLSSAKPESADLVEGGLLSSLSKTDEEAPADVRQEDINSKE